MSDLARNYIFDLDELDEVLARCYLRVSKDKSGRERSPKEQLDEAERAVGRKRTWRLGESYGDVGSASQWKRKEREAFQRLMADLRADRFGAHVLILWEASRGSRSVPEWHELLDLLARRNVFVYITSMGHVFNPNKAFDWRHLMDMGVSSEFEVRQLRERQQRAGDADVAAGNFTGGRRPFGFEADGVKHRPSEVALIHDAVRAVLSGDSPRAIAKRWNAAGIPTSAGNEWHPGPLANMLRSARLVGKRVHKGVIVGDAVWKPILDEVTQRRVMAALSTRTPVGRAGREAWALTGFLRCERCGATMVGNTGDRGVRRYICRKAPGAPGCGGVGIKASAPTSEQGALEEQLGRLVVERLTDAVARRSTGGPDDAAELAELASIAARRAATNEDYGLGLIERDDKNSTLATLNRRHREIEKRLAAKAQQSDSALDFIVEDGLVGRTWGELSVDEQRRILTALVESVTIGSATRRGSTAFESDRFAGLLPDGTPRIAWRA